MTASATLSPWKADQPVAASPRRDEQQRRRPQEDADAEVAREPAALGEDECEEATGEPADSECGESGESEHPEHEVAS